MNIANIHAVRASGDALQALCKRNTEDNWLSKLEATGWLKHVRVLLSGNFTHEVMHLVAFFMLISFWLCYSGGGRGAQDGHATV